MTTELVDLDAVRALQAAVRAAFDALIEAACQAGAMARGEVR